MKRRVKRVGECTLILGDCRDVLAQFAAGSIDAVVCDPPYDLTATSRRGSPRTNNPETSFSGHHRQTAGGFMGQRWDATGIAFDPTLWAALLRVLKPGGHLLAFGGSRTYHRMACAIEDAGFEIRDQIMWVYGSGFPKSLDVGRALDRRGDSTGRTSGRRGKRGLCGNTDVAKEWDGWGTALKPAHEPIVVARKPPDSTVAENVLRYGTGALNIDGCRIPGGGGKHRGDEPSRDRRYAGRGATNFAPLPGPRGGDPTGRWPANLIHDGSDEVLAAFPNAKGQQGAVTGREPSSKTNNVYGAYGGRPATNPRNEQSTSAARFFYCAKATRRDREDGLDGLPGPEGNAQSRTIRNHHPTVKPTALMRYLCRLVIPPGGIVLDPFMGSGSTGKAATVERFRFVGIEREEDYFDIACRRIKAACTRVRGPRNC
jgi:site-specific DNA-methyltransferase (adenine-specific)